MERHTWNTATDWDNNQAESLVEHTGYRPATVKPTPLPVEDLAAYWRLDGDGANGTVYDSSGNDNHGDIGTSAPIFGEPAPGVIGRSANFNGGGDEVTFPQSESLRSALNSAPVTIGAWYKPNENSGNWSTIFSWRVNNDAGDQKVQWSELGDEPVTYTRWIAATADNGLSTSDGGVWARTTNGHAIGEWHFWVGTFDGSTFVNYQDGEVNDTTNKDVDLADLIPDTILRLNPNEDSHIAEFFIAQDRAFSASKVSEIYDAYANGWTGSITTAESE